jgi:hypothetical protein
MFYQSVFRDKINYFFILEPVFDLPRQIIIFLTHWLVVRYTTVSHEILRASQMDNILTSSTVKNLRKFN